MVKRYSILLEDGTVGETSLCFEPKIGNLVIVSLHDENGIPIEKDGMVKAILSVEVQALAKTISPKMAEVVTVVDIDGNGACGYASRTGAKRQRYHVGGIAKREIGKKKRISTCAVI